MCLSKTRDFAKDLHEEFGELKVLGLKSVYGTSYNFFYASRGRELQAYFPSRSRFGLD